MRTFKMYSRNTKTTKEPTASNNKSDRPQVNIWDTWKTLKYLNINDSFHLKDLEICIGYNTIETKEAARIGYNAGVD
jgi:hypothetical protein